MTEEEKHSDKEILSNISEHINPVKKDESNPTAEYVENKKDEVYEEIGEGESIGEEVMDEYSYGEQQEEEASKSSESSSSSSSSSSSPSESELEKEEDQDEEKADGLPTVIKFPDIPHPLDNFTGPQLVKLIETMEVNLKHMELENRIFLNFFMKNDSQILEGMERVLKTASALQGRTSVSSRRLTSASMVSSRMFSTSRMGSTASFATVSAGGARVNLSQRTDLVMREIEEIQQELEKVQKSAEIKKDRLLADLEELNVRSTEISDALDIFRQDILIDGIDPITQRVPAEKWIRYIDEWLKSAQSTIDKIRLRTSSLKVQYQVLSNQLTHKLLIGENLHEIDFEKLEIENKHLLIKIETKTLLLFEMKKMAGLANLTLSNHKKKLRQQQEERRKLEEMIKLRQEKVNQFDNEKKQITSQLDHAKDKHNEIKQKIEDYEVPEVLDFVKTKAKLHILKKNVKTLARQKQVKDMALNGCIIEMKNLTGCKKIDPNWFIILPKESLAENRSATDSDLTIYSHSNKDE